MLKEAILDLSELKVLAFEDKERGPLEIRFQDIDSVCWTDTIYADGKYQTKGYILLKVRIDYADIKAVKIDESDEPYYPFPDEEIEGEIIYVRHGEYSNLYLHKKANQDPKYRIGYCILEAIAGEKPSKTAGKKVETELVEICSWLYENDYFPRKGFDF